MRGSRRARDHPERRDLGVPRTQPLLRRVELLLRADPDDLAHRTEAAARSPRRSTPPSRRATPTSRPSSPRPTSPGLVAVGRLAQLRAARRGERGAVERLPGRLGPYPRSGEPTGPRRRRRRHDPRRSTPRSARRCPTRSRRSRRGPVRPRTSSPPGTSDPISISITPTAAVGTTVSGTLFVNGFTPGSRSPARSRSRRRSPTSSPRSPTSTRSRRRRGQPGRRRHTDWGSSESAPKT